MSTQNKDGAKIDNNSRTDKRPYGDTRRQQAGEHPRKPVELHTITCSMCGKEDSVPFLPTRGTAVLCRDCYSVKRQRKNRNRETLRKIVGKFTIVCKHCGKEAVVSYRRATAPVQLCDTCYETLKGESPDQERRQRLKVITAITCCRCGRRDHVDFVPEDESKVLCRACYRREQTPR